jgi:4-amino-4-deoxy-L-arabinose transferase-like glycosyltransferase
MTEPAGAHAGKYPVFVFLFVAALLCLVHGNRFVLTNDEGILLEPAQRLVQGARPYVDFFGYMSPGSYWIQAALFRLFGTTMLVARLPVILGFSLQSALVFWLVAQLASRRAATAAVVAFVGFQIADPSFLTAQHRWDSATLALAGVCCAIGSTKVWRLGASGVLLALAALCTPSVALVAVVAGIWLLCSRKHRHLFLPFAAGAGAVMIAAAGALWATGSLLAFFNQMLWLKKNYTTVNMMPYGSIIGGYSRLLEGPGGIEALVRYLLVLCLTLPAILPPLAILLWGILTLRKHSSYERRSWEVLLLASASLALIVSTFPRADMMHLAFISALPCALAAAGLARLLPVRAGAILAFSVIPFALLFSLYEFTGFWNARAVSTPVGTLRAAPELAPELQKLVSVIHPGEALFIYPYMPVHYFVTQARNPTRFAFLAPGMMTSTEEGEALSELSAHPPEWLLYLQLNRDEYLRVFPNATGLNPHFETIEAWFQANYEPVEPPGVNIAGYRLWKRTPESSAAVR